MTAGSGKPESILFSKAVATPGKSGEPAGFNEVSVVGRKAPGVSGHDRQEARGEARLYP